MRLRPVLGNLVLLGGTCFALFLLFEFVVFRYLLPTNDVLENVSINNVVRYVPGTTGRVYGPDGHVSQVNINADGWNSLKPRYQLAKTPGRLRVAVIGDSYVQARHVDTGKAAPALIERELKRRGVDAEVLRFGVDGAPLSQYLHMLRAEVLRFRPDVVVVQLIHNDFDESYRLLKGRTTSSFMKVIPDGKGGFREVAPEEFRPGFADTMRSIRSFRYFYYQTGLVENLKGYVSRYFWGDTGEFPGSGDLVSSAVDIRSITESRKIRAVTDYVFQQMKALAEEHHFHLLFAMDGVREAVYAGRDASLYEVGRLNKIASSVAKTQRLPFVDLHDAFARNYAVNGKRFEYSWDWHWNELGHQIVGKAIAGRILELPGIGRSRLPAQISGISTGAAR